MSKSSPDFSFFESAPVINARTGKNYTLEKITVLESDEGTLADIARICNEPAIYNTFFRNRLNGAPYTAAHARDYLEWGRKGWDENTCFVFVVLDEQKRIAGQVSINSNDLAAGQLGYWASANHSGIITPAVKALSKAAAQAGYISFVASIRPQNERSRGVLLRNGFNRVARDSRNDEPRDLFRKNLQRNLFDIPAIKGENRYKIGVMHGI